MAASEAVGKESKVKLAVGIFCVLLGVGLGLYFLGDGLYALATKIVPYSSVPVKNALFTIWGFFAGVVTVGLITASVVVGIMAKRKAAG